MSALDILFTNPSVAVSISYDDNQYTMATSKECSRYDTKQSDDKAPVIWKLWSMKRTPSLPLLPGPLWRRVEAPDRILPIAQIELFNI